MRKHIAKYETNSINLIFNKFITNIYKKEKRLRSRNHNILINTNLSVKYCLNNKKRV